MVRLCGVELANAFKALKEWAGASLLNIKSSQVAMRLRPTPAVCNNLDYQTETIAAWLVHLILKAAKDSYRAVCYQPRLRLLLLRQLSKWAWKEMGCRWYSS
jgi:hypothetical protein